MGTSATYTQLRDGSWGIRVPGNAREGQSITVAKKDGSTKSETVSKVLWTGRDSKSGQTISLCSIGSGKSSGNRGSGETKRCWECGCNFTYGDAKRNGGDWADSYCGC